ncbi:hypothetical protein [Corynebacterium diphtheriae]|nr:hypothetical protein [Corynebacterium diphtheriae]
MSLRRLFMVLPSCAISATPVSFMPASVSVSVLMALLAACLLVVVPGLL